ncbi:M48 family metallopeptidase [Hymenobacter sp. 15J16-1T3B]|uniref:M48 family metallopeptidase n=1 Tax=Hymenobacter sp. 15J16-1T3B TaxID=2886941 RepID=UPI001D1208FD|nr:SprT family zinc-dependent metalloprotease [Hymenobacter sp. 15J16-1T3B]MCC3156789.1 M48 family metallopeptidase [Hymenobacter sp. 15J16-1T3B]
MSKTVQIAGLEVELVRKAIRTLRVTVYPPHGRVRVAAPLRLPEANIHEFVAARRAWIEKHRARFATQTPAAELTYSSGETHYYRGHPYQLRVHAAESRARVLLQEDGILDLYAPASSTAAERQQVLTAWYRARLKEQIPALLARWEPVVGARAAAWGIKQMRTRWGTCNTRAQRIWLSLELIKKPQECLEYVLVHELTHLHERLHNARFWGLMDQFMPEWRQYKARLNQAAPGVQQPTGADAD